jgi:recombination protein U
MLVKFPGGIRNNYQINKNEKKKKDSVELSISASNRGMSFENEINISNDYYRENDIALITKRPTPINVVKVDYSKGNKIVDAYFEKQSTTDYNGIYKGKYIDFEAKNTKNKTSFPLSNITNHQINHLQKVKQHGGIAFFLVKFELLNEVFLLDAEIIIEFINKKERKSIPHNVLIEKGIKIKGGYLPRYDYIKAVEEKYFNV